MQQTPLDIPELRLLIGSFLDQSSLKACTLVCNAWHQDFQRLVWRVFFIPYIQDLRDAETLAAWESSVRKYGCWTKHVYAHAAKTHALLSNVVVATLLEHCQSLVSITVELGTEPWHHSSSVLKQNAAGSHELYVLSTRYHRRFWSDPVVWRILHGLQQLQHLELWSITFPDMIRVMKACPSLCGLTVQVLQAPLNQPDPSHDLPVVVPATSKPTKTFALRRLGIHFIKGHFAVVDLLPRLPALESLFVGGEGDALIEGLESVFREGMLPRLCEVGLALVGNFVDVVSAIPQGQLRSAALRTDDAATVKALLRQQGPNLEQLSLIAFEDGPTLAQIFFECVKLKKLELDLDPMSTLVHGSGNSRKVLDIRYLLDKPWVCKDLKRLIAPFGLKYSLGGNISLALSEAMDEDQKAGRDRTRWTLAKVLFEERLSQLKRLPHEHFTEQVWL